MNKKLTEVTNVDRRNVLISALASEQQKHMMASSSKLPFSAHIFVKPHSSINPTKPKGILVLSVFLFSGIFLCIAFLFFRIINN